MCQFSKIYPLFLNYKRLSWTIDFPLLYANNFSEKSKLISILLSNEHLANMSYMFFDFLRLFSIETKWEMILGLLTENWYLIQDSIRELMYFPFLVLVLHVGTITTGIAHHCCGCVWLLGFWVGREMNYCFFFLCLISTGKGKFCLITIPNKSHEHILPSNFYLH